MPQADTARIGDREPMEVVVVHGHRIGLGTTMVMVAISIVVPVVMRMHRGVVVSAALVRRHLRGLRVEMIRTHGTDIQAGHHAKNH